MPDVRPRVGKRRGIGRTLFCGFSLCHGTVGGICFGTVPSALPFSLPPHQGSLELRGLVEKQAPPGSVGWAAWVLPEGFGWDARRAAWVPTRHGEAHWRATLRPFEPRRATHQSRPRLAGTEVYSAIVPLPTVVVCPECGRRNTVERELLGATLAQLAEELNGVADEVRRDASAGDRWLAQQLELPPEWVERLVAELPPWEMARLLLVFPQFVLVLRAVQTGESVRAEHFFVVDLPRPVLVAQPDAANLPPPPPARSSPGSTQAAQPAEH